jgi:GNAT superfamily N-acetyltransferase
MRSAQGWRIVSIEIEILTGDASWPLVKPLFDAVWPPEVVQTLPYAGVEFANPDLRVLIEDADGVACHVGIIRRETKWNGRKLLVGGIGGVSTRPDCRGRGYASIALNAAIRTLKDERTAQAGLLFCEERLMPFYRARDWHDFDGEIVIEQRGTRTRLDSMRPMVFDVKRAPRQGTIDLCGLPW